MRVEWWRKLLNNNGSNRNYNGNIIFPNNSFPNNFSSNDYSSTNEFSTNFTTNISSNLLSRS
jgi:hypothetical protein